MIGFDIRLGAPGLHDVAGAVHPHTRSTVSPPDSFSRHERDACWNDPTLLPSSVRLL